MRSCFIYGAQLSRLVINITVILDCIRNPCQNSGTCIEGVNGYSCNCVSGYEGINCETSNLNQNDVSLVILSIVSDTTDECASSPCQNSGTCADAVNEYSCNCVSGYEGTNCETSDLKSGWYFPNVILSVVLDTDECASGPCQNSGACVDGVNGYSCNCVSGYEGTNCTKSDLKSVRYVSLSFYLLF